MLLLQKENGNVWQIQIEGTEPRRSCYMRKKNITKHCAVLKNYTHIR